MPRFVVALSTFLLVTSAARADFAYRPPAEVNKLLKSLAGQHKGMTRLQPLGKTPGGREIELLMLGKQCTRQPAILVVANMEGDAPLASEAALELSRLLLGDWKADLENHCWYILPVGNPDGYARFFSKPQAESFTNARPINDDHDDATDEDGPEDLNRDGLITTMRQRHPEGEWMPVEKNPVLMKKAERGKGEVGVYRLFSEGIDNDRDGSINEDGPGGVNPGHNFPHNFNHYTNTGGRWAASEPESRAVLGFAYDHPEIAMLLTFGRSNSIKKVPEGQKEAQAGQDKYKVPEKIAKRVGLDPEVEYPLKDLVQMAREFTGYKELTEEMVLQFLGVGAAVKPDAQDLPYWTEIGERYQEFMKKAGLEGERLDPSPPPPGALEEWGYYQFGAVSLSMDFWTLPAKKKEKKEGQMSPEEIEKMSDKDFIALGKEKIDAFLKASSAPAHLKAEMVIQALTAGMLSTKKIAEMLRQHLKKEESGGVDETDQALYDFDPKAFIAWEPYDHPTLGKVEIGGRRPYAHLLPPAATAPELIAKQLPFVRELTRLLPRVSITKTEVKARGPGVWEVQAWASNQGFFPYPSHQGERCKRPTPAVLTLEGDSILLLEGDKRRVLGLLPGSGGAGKALWVFQGKQGSSITVRLQGFSAGQDTKSVTLEGGGK